MSGSLGLYNNCQARGKASMRFDSLIIEISATPAYLLLFFIIITALFHLVLVWWVKLDDNTWKKVDYVWLGAAALGLISLSTTAEQWMSRAFLDNFETARTASAYGQLRGHLEMGASPSSPLCMKRERSQFSPPDFDQMVREQQDLCISVRALTNTMPKNLAPPFPPLEKIGFIPFAGSIKYEEWYVSEANKGAENYRVQQEKYAQLEDSLKASSWEKFYTVMGPLVLSIALALRITKVSGELANAKSKSKAKMPNPAVKRGDAKTRRPLLSCRASQAQTSMRFRRMCKS